MTIMGVCLFFVVFPEHSPKTGTYSHPQKRQAHIKLVQLAQALCWSYQTPFLVAPYLDI